MDIVYVVYVVKSRTLSMKKIIPTELHSQSKTFIMKKLKPTSMLKNKALRHFTSKKTHQQFRRKRLPCGLHTRECRWSWRGWRCQLSEQSLQEHPQGFPAATGFSSFGSRVSFPKKYNLMDWEENYIITVGKQITTTYLSHNYRRDCLSYLTTPLLFVFWGHLKVKRLKKDPL